MTDLNDYVLRALHHLSEFIHTCQRRMRATLKRKQQHRKSGGHPQQQHADDESGSLRESTLSLLIDSCQKARKKIEYHLSFAKTYLSPAELQDIGASLLMEYLHRKDALVASSS